MTVKKTSSSSTGENYEVFARDNPERPLQHIGTVQADNQQLAIAHARFVYSERIWAELLIAPTASFSNCLKPQLKGVVGMA
jgi:1,2-phenylacetyl-CoA epoxidase PaaB subunit